MTNTELLPCPFERGQVWKNPEDKLMMVMHIVLFDDGYSVSYVSENGQMGMFSNREKHILDNIEMVDTRADKAAPVERIEGLKEAVEFRREIAEFGISRVDNFFGMNKEKPKLSLDTILWIAARAYLKLQGGE